MISLDKINKHRIMFLLLLLAFLLFFLPAGVLAADTNTPPNVAIKSIKVINGVTTITGTVSDDHTLPQDIVMNLVGEGETPASITTSSDGKWSITKTLTQKLNQLTIEAIDKPLALTEEPKLTSIPVQRPFVTSIKMKVVKYLYKINENEVRDEAIDVDLMQSEDLTRVSINPTLIRIKLSDEVSRDLPNPIAIYNENFVKITGGDFVFEADNQIKLTLNNLSPGKTYYLMFNPSLISTKYNNGEGLFVDANDNKFFPIMKKFTTVSDTVKSQNPEKVTAINKFTAEVPEQPHGFYTNNVNTCGNCHSTHVAERLNLDKTIPAYRDKAKENSYCMACHDGTVAVPMPGNYDSKNNMIKSMHTAVEDSEHPSSAGSCTTCHNPHLTWSENNPNLLKDHYVHTNNGLSRDSLDDNCQSCHEGNSVSGPAGYHENSVREVLSYKKSTAASGQKGEFSLCLRCHNGGKASNIKQYYEDEEKNEIVKSGHTIIALDSSYLNGNLPCAECHETHGSKNLLLLKDLLGHENQQEFSFTAGYWANKEREFCIKCHNSKTAIRRTGLYGVTGLFNETLIQHQDISKVCSECHGGIGTPKEKALRAAHAPIILRQEKPTTQSSPIQVEPSKNTSTTESNTTAITTNTPSTDPSPTTKSSNQ